LDGNWEFIDIVVFLNSILSDWTKENQTSEYISVILCNKMDRDIIYFFRTKRFAEQSAYSCRNRNKKKMRVKATMVI
jgi:hypothetical protein